MDFSVFTTFEGWFSLLTLTFLEVVLGFDNLAFIAITSNRLVPEKRHIGRRLGLAGALVMRILLLCFAAYLVHLNSPLFTIDGWRIHGEPFGLSIKDIVLIAGGIYLIYKGIAELRAKLALTEEKAEDAHATDELKHIGLAQAVFTIMVMDIVFSLDSVFTAVGLSGILIVMIPAVIIAVTLMIIFADPISDFISRHAEMTILALVFIIAIGVLLIYEGIGYDSGIYILGMEMENLMVYFAMVFALILEFIQMRYNSNLKRYKEGSEKK